MCTSPSTAFAWVGAILVNIGFITLISWGAATLWPLGFGLSALYTVFLFGVANWFEGREDYQEILTETADEEEEEEQGGRPLELTSGAASDASGPSSTIPKVSVLVSLLYGLAVISVGVTGFFLPINLFPECKDSGNWKPKWTWTTNLTSLPPGVQNWARSDKIVWNRATFGYINSTDTTLFSGTASDSENSCLWEVQPSKAPVRHKDLLRPDQFTTLSDETICFQSTNELYSRQYARNIYCSNGTAFRSAIDPTKRAHHSDAFNLFASDGLLWFKESPSNNEESGRLIYSLDPDSMIMSLHSQRARTSDGSSCQPSQTIRKQAFVALITTALPITLASIAIWKVKQIPSMAVTTYVGFTFIYVSALVVIDPDLEYKTNPFKWWFAMTGLIWLLVLSYLVVSESIVRFKDPLRWGLVIGGIAFMSGMIGVLLGEHDSLWRWILLNLFAFVPLILLGAATETIFLMLLGACGLLIDSGRFAEFVGDHVKGEAVFPIQFLVFSLTGLFVGALGFQLSKYQYHVKEWVVALVQKVDSLMSRRRSSMPEEDDASNPLLPPSAEES